MPKLTDLVVRSIGVVDKAANGSQFIYRSEKPDASGFYTVSVPIILKFDKATGIASGIIYEADKVDSQGDWTDLETIVIACHDFAKQMRFKEVDIMHDGRLGKGDVLEHFMMYAQQPGYPTISNAAWAMKILLGEEARMRTEDGELTGFSLEGRAKLDFSATPPTSKTASAKPLIKAARRKPQISISR